MTLFRNFASKAAACLFMTRSDRLLFCNFSTSNITKTGTELLLSKHSSQTIPEADSAEAARLLRLLLSGSYKKQNSYPSAKRVKTKGCNKYYITAANVWYEHKMFVDLHGNLIYNYTESPCRLRISFITAFCGDELHCASKKIRKFCQGAH